MMIIETREAAKDKAFELIDEMKDLGHQKKMALCELEDTLYDCFESEEDENTSDESEYDDQDMDFRSRSSKYRKSMMRDDDDFEDYEMSKGMRSSRGMRNMRRRRGMRIYRR